ncbi:hypothetical protein HMPREF0189_00878 [Burkholderiales bacterium 1_1_47]|nr:hypothetical protein HMPREF0189_00878 [Burkholderiales bacterium 1_1_47]
MKGVRLFTIAFFSLSRSRAFAGEQGISGFPRLFQINTLKFYLLGLSTGCDPSPMLEGVSSRQHRSYLSELLTIGRRARN